MATPLDTFTRVLHQEIQRRRAEVGDGFKQWRVNNRIRTADQSLLLDWVIAHLREPAPEGTAPDDPRVAAFKRDLLVVATHDPDQTRDPHKWRHDNVRTLHQSHVLDEIEEALTRRQRIEAVIATATTTATTSPFDAFKRAVHQEVQRGRAEAFDGYRRWRGETIHTGRQSLLLDWVEAVLRDPEPDDAAVTAFKRDLLPVVTEGIATARAGNPLNGWRMDNVVTARQSSLLDQIEEALTAPRVLRKARFPRRTKAASTATTRPTEIAGPSGADMLNATMPTRAPRRRATRPTRKTTTPPMATAPKAAKKPLAPKKPRGRTSLYRGKVRTKPMTTTLTPRHWALLKAAAKRLGLTWADTVGLLIETGAATLQLPKVPKP